MSQISAAVNQYPKVTPSQCLFVQQAPTPQHIQHIQMIQMKSSRYIFLHLFLTRVKVYHIEMNCNYVRGLNN